jgi:parvulin-like peptidyl-prolyl isomerase
VGITLTEYQAEMVRYQLASGVDLTEEDRKRVLDALIDETLLAQAAAEKGFIVNDELIEERMNSLLENVGGQAALDEWLTTNGYDLPGFRQVLGRSVAAAWMRDQVIAQVSDTADHVHARQILMRTREEAEQVYAQLQNGEGFDELAAKYDPVTRGELGWFSRGYLLQPDVEQAVFALEPGQYSNVVETPIGFHIVLVIERDPQRSLEPQARLELQKKAMQDWLEQQRSQSEIIISLTL